MSDAPTPDPSAGPAAGATPAGWYPDGSGGQRYWDGATWTDHVAGATPPVPVATPPYAAAPAAASDEVSMAVLAHALGIIASFVGPLIIYLVKGNDSAYVRHHAAEALNFAITVFIASFVSALLMLVLIGFILLPLVGIGALVLHILAAVAASRGEWYRYPINLRLVPGAMGG